MTKSQTQDELIDVLRELQDTKCYFKQAMSLIDIILAQLTVDYFYEMNTKQQIEYDYLCKMIEKFGK